MTQSRPGGERSYTDEDVRRRLAAELPSWYLDEGCICRKYRTGGWRASLMVVNAIGHLAEAAFHHPDLQVSYASVTVRLRNHAANGITDKDFALATRIEGFIQWQPGREEGPLEGVPEESHMTYIRYDTPGS